MVFCYAYPCYCPAVPWPAGPAARLLKPKIQNNYKVRNNNRRNRIYYSALLPHSEYVPPTHGTNRSTPNSLTQLKTNTLASIIHQSFEDIYKPHPLSRQLHGPHFTFKDTQLFNDVTICFVFVD